jgi:hypothetical protein
VDAVSPWSVSAVYLLKRHPGSLLETVPSNMGHRFWQSSNDQVPASTAECGQRLAQQGLHHPPNSYIHSPAQMTQVYQEHDMTTSTSFQMSAPDTGYGIEQAHILPATPQVSQVGSIYGCPYVTFMTPLAYQQQQQQSSKLERFHEGFAYDHLDVHQMHASGSGKSVHAPTKMSSHCHHDSMQSRAHAYNSILSPTHSPPGNSGLSVQVHHHRLLDRSLQSMSHWSGYEHGVAAVEEQDPRSVVGQPGMPEPAAKPKGLKIKFSPEDDVLLVRLKETKNLTWKQIADFFPGRSSGTLQVRYCTRLKAKRMVWTEDMVGRWSFLEVDIAC